MFSKFIYSAPYSPNGCASFSKPSEAWKKKRFHWQKAFYLLRLKCVCYLKADATIEASSFVPGLAWQWGRLRRVPSARVIHIVVPTGETASDSASIPYSTGQLGHRTAAASVSSLLRHSYAFLKIIRVKSYTYSSIM